MEKKNEDSNENMQVIIIGHRKIGRLRPRRKAWSDVIIHEGERSTEKVDIVETDNLMRRIGNRTNKLHYIIYSAFVKLEHCNICAVHEIWYIFYSMLVGGVCDDSVWIGN